MPGIKFPSFKDFVNAQNPAMAFVYVLIIGISVLFTFLIKANAAENKRQETSIKTCADKTDKLSTEVGFLTEQIRRRDSAFAALSTRLDVLKEMGKIQ